MTRCIQNPKGALWDNSKHLKMELNQERLQAMQQEEPLWCPAPAPAPSRLQERSLSTPFQSRGSQADTQQTRTDHNPSVVLSAAPHSSRVSSIGVSGNRMDRTCHRPRTPLLPRTTALLVLGRASLSPLSPVINTPTQKIHWALSQATPAPGSFFANQRSSLISYRAALPGPVLTVQRAKTWQAQPLAPESACPVDPPPVLAGAGLVLLHQQQAGAEKSTSEDLTQHKPLLHSLRKENAFRHSLHY